MASRSSNWTAASVAAVALAMWLTGMISAFGEDKKCPESNSGLSLPNGFCATIFADKLGHARQLVVAPDGTVYINSWSGVMYGRDTPHPADS